MNAERRKLVLYVPHWMFRSQEDWKHQTLNSTKCVWTVLQ